MNIIRITHLLSINAIMISISRNGIPLLFKISKELFIETISTIESGDEIGYEFDATDPITITSVFKIKDYNEYHTTINKLIIQAHDNLTWKRGRPEYAPDFHELQEEINKMDTYTIKKAYPTLKDTEIEITSKNLIYAEMGVTHSGCQSNNLKNNDEIHKKCVQITNLIREIEQLNISDETTTNNNNTKGKS